MKNLFLHIRAIIASILMLSACAEIDQPFSAADRVLKIETKWLSDSNGNRLLKVLNKEYDKDGRLIRVTEFDSNGTAKLIRKIQYTNASCSETAEYLNSVGSADSVKLYTSIFNERGNVSKKIEINTIGDTLSISNYKYDNNGNLVYSKLIVSKGNSVTETNYEYNQLGSLSTSIQKDAITGAIQRKDSLVYNNQLSSIDKILMDNDGKYKTIITFIFDKFGKIYKEVENDPTGRIIRTFIYDYIYY